MKSKLSSREIQKRIKYLLNSVHISFELAKALKWSKLYKILKKAQKLNGKLAMSKKSLKQFSKDITNSNFNLNRESSITIFYNVKLNTYEEPKVTYKFIPFIKPFISNFLDEHPILII